MAGISVAHSTHATEPSHVSAGIKLQQVGAASAQAGDSA